MNRLEARRHARRFEELCRVGMGMVDETTGSELEDLISEIPGTCSFRRFLLRYEFHRRGYCFESDGASFEDWPRELGIDVGRNCYGVFERTFLLRCERYHFLHLQLTVSQLGTETRERDFIKRLLVEWKSEYEGVYGISPE